MSRRSLRRHSQLVCQRLEERTVPATFAPHTVTELRQAITAASASADATSEIILDKNATYTLTDADPSNNGAGLPTISPAPNHTITITGNGATLTRDLAAPQFRLAQATNGGALVIDNLTFSNGSPVSTGGTAVSGGALWVFTSGAPGVSLTLNGCTFQSNTSSDGGAVNYRSTKLSFQATNCLFQSNTSTDAGGAVEVTGGVASFVNCTFDKNTAANNGGGLFTDTSNVQITGCTFSSNRATAVDSYGGGLYNLDQVAIADSTFTGNSADRGGGIAYADSGFNQSGSNQPGQSHLNPQRIP